MIENMIIWFAFMVFLTLLNLYAMSINLRILNLLVVAVTLFSVGAMWSEFAGMEVIAFSVIMINGVLAVVGMVR